MKVTKQEHNEIIEKRIKEIKKDLFSILRDVKRSIKLNYCATAKIGVDEIKGNLDELSKLKNGKR